jgi:hypothetical protein
MSTNYNASQYVDLTLQDFNDLRKARALAKPSTTVPKPAVDTSKTSIVTNK